MNNTISKVYNMTYFKYKLWGNLKILVEMKLYTYLPSTFEYPLTYIYGI